MKKIGFLVMLSMSLLLSGCGSMQDNSYEAVEANIAAKNTKIENKESTKVGYQLEKPQVGEEIAVVKTNSGNFKMRFFPDEAPKTVENFKELVKKHYYDGVIFHRVIKDFMIQGGDPTGTGMGGESVWGRDFEDEFSSNIFNITGAVAMANHGPNTNGSQFFINNANTKVFPGWERIKHYVDMKKVTSEIKKIYEENGGNITLDGYLSPMGRGHTVFAQVFEGIDIVQKISEVKTNKDDKPLEDVVIKSIVLEKFN